MRGTSTAKMYPVQQPLEMTGSMRRRYTPPKNTNGQVKMSVCYQATLNGSVGQHFVGMKSTMGAGGWWGGEPSDKSDHKHYGELANVTRPGGGGGGGGGK